MNAKRIAAAWMGLALVLGLAPMGQLPAQAANNPIHFSRQPAQRSVYAKGAPMRLSVQAESTEGKALSYQWKWSESADLSNAHTVTGVGGSGQQAVLTATTPTAIGSHYFWVEVTADGATVCSDTAEVVVLDEIVADTYTVGHTKADGSTYTQSDYDGYYLKYNQLFTKLLNGNMQDDAFTAYDGYTAGGGSTRANRSTTLNVSISAGAHFAFWDTTHIARSLSGGATNKEIQRVINSGSQNLAWDFAAEDGAYVQPTWDGTHLAGVANKGQHEFNGGVELSGDWPSSIYQEIATVPGKVYEWSLDHGQFALTGKHELMAVVIGPAAESDDTFFPYGKVSAALGSAGGGQQTLFYQVVDQVLEEQSLGKPTLDSLGSFQSQAYSTTYDGSHYYVYLARTGGTRFGGVRHSGAYSVPRGQGRTVFGFVDIVTHSSTDGNLLDNIVFKSGSAPSQEQAVAYSGESSIHGDTVAGYAYALAEVRGSAVYPLQERDAWFTPSGGSAQTASVNAGLGDGVSWYTPGKGTLTFKNLVPGKTYRLIGIPSATVSTALGTNVAPADVLDEGYYADTTIKAGKDDIGADGFGPNVSASIYNVGTSSSPFWRGRVTLAATDSRAQYTLLSEDSMDRWVPVSASGALLSHDSADSAAYWRTGTGAALSFNGLDPGRQYRVVVRPAGYTELDWATLAADTSTPAVLVTVPQPGQEVTADMVARESQSASDKVFLTGVDAAGSYHLLDATTGKQLWSGTGNTSYTITLDGCGAATSVCGHALQAVAEVSGTFTAGVRVYPYPEFAQQALAIDYVGESIGLGAGNVPAGIEFQVDYQGENLITVPDTADGYRAASGSARLQLGAATSYTAGPLLDAITTGTATLRYRLARAAGYDGEYVAPASQLAIPARPEGDADSADVDWAAETFDGQSFASYGYSGLSAIDIPISQPAVAGEKFRSKVVNFTINARPAAPTGLGADYTGGVFTVSGLEDGVDYEYSTDRSTWTAISAVADGKAALGSASVYYVRFAAVPASHNPASLATRASDYPLSVDNVSFGEQVYGYGALAAAAVTVANKAGSSTEGTDRTTTLSIEGQLKDGQPFAEGAFEIDGSASLELPVLVPGSAVDSGYRVKAKEGLPAGAYTATLVLGYDGGSGPATAAADITFAVTKATWASPTLEAQVGVLGDDISVTLTEPLPDGEAAEYSLDHSAWQDSGDFPGLGWATQYELWARVKADANHFASASVLLEPKIFTAYQQPVWDDVLRLNYAAETVEFLPGAVSTDYQISSGGQPVAANAGLGFLLDGAGGDLTLVRVGADDPRNGPIDSEGASVQLNPRSAAPDSGDLSTTPAATATQPTGTIVHSLGKAFEYRLHGSSGAWTQAVGGTATAVAYGDYDVRFPATDSAFASRAAEVAVGALYLEYAITWSDPLEEGLATGSELDVEEVGAGPIGQHAKVAGGHDVAFTLAADSLDAWFRATLNTGAPGEPDLVQTADGHLSPGRVEFRFTTTVNSELSATSKVEAFAKRAAVFDANGGSGSPAATGNTLADPDYQVSLPDGAGLRRPGYVFTGWNTAADGTGFAYAAGDRYELDADCASQPLYAQWAATAGELLRAAGQAVSVSGGSGTASDPFTVPAVFPNDVAQLRAADLAVSPGAAATVSHTQDYQPDDAVPLTAGAATDVFAVVTPEAGGTWHYVIKAFRLAASSSLAELLDALGGLRASGALQAYTDESVQALDDAMAAADALLAGTPTQAQVDAASQAVLAAVEGLRAKTVPAPLPTPTPAPQPGPDPTPSPSPVPGPAVPVAGIAIAGAPAQAAYKQGGKGNRIQLSATVTPADASDKTLRWSSSNSALASVDASGLVTLHDGEGTVVITAAAADGSGVRDTQQLKVVRNVTAVRTPLLKLYLRRGTTYKLPVAVDDSTQMAKHISSAVTYKSSNSKVLQVDAHGKLTTSAKVSKTTKVYLDVLAANGKKLRVSVYVVPKAKALGGVKLAIPKKATMKVGKAFVLKLKGTKSATNVLPRFKSSKPSVISVGKAGKLVALKKGKSTITVKIGGKTIKRTIRVQ